MKQTYWKIEEACRRNVTRTGSSERHIKKGGKESPLAGFLGDLFF